MLRLILCILFVFVSFVTGVVVAKPYHLYIKRTVSGCLSIGHKTALDNIFVAAACSDLKTELELPEGYCSNTHLTEAAVFRTDVNECLSGSKYQITGQFPADATWE